ncbi:uncharacterized protein LOC113548641 isoform X3 [Rhopalosiphum maidis]|uniref:uncharacterized protein LOC113548641 isoform X3 n=1 Tax=Rhopalosiphum maidis TaxID=43146 RepID=UPI000F009C0F|nr:uncharacterized protein LOC113548641 isoform X3 [Rhopalosiphum maidis]
MLVETVSDAHVHFHYSARRFRDVLLANILATQNKNKVNNAGKAAKSGVREGFLIESINSASVDHLTSNEAQALIRNSGDKLTIGIYRQSKSSIEKNDQKHEAETKAGADKSVRPKSTETETPNKKSKRIRKRRRKKKRADSPEKLNGQHPKTLPNKIIEQAQEITQITENPKIQIIPENSDSRFDELEWIKHNEALLIADLKTRQQAGLPIQVVVRVEKITPSVPEYCQIIPDFCHLDVIKEETSASDDDPKKETWESSEKIRNENNFKKLPEDQGSDVDEKYNNELENISEVNENKTNASECQLERLESPSLVRESEILRFADIVTTENEYVIDLETLEPLKNTLTLHNLENNERIDRGICSFLNKNNLTNEKHKDDYTLKDVNVNKSPIQHEKIINNYSIVVNGNNGGKNQFITNTLLDTESCEDTTIYFQKNCIEVDCKDQKMNNLDVLNTKSQHINYSDSPKLSSQLRMKKDNKFPKNVFNNHQENMEHEVESSDDSTIKQCKAYDHKHKLRRQNKVSIHDKLKQIARLLQDDTDDYEEIQSSETTSRCVSIASDADVDTDWVSFTLSDGESSKSLCLSPSQSKSCHVPSSFSKTSEIIDLHKKFLNRTRSPNLSPRQDLTPIVDILSYNKSQSQSPSKSYSSEVFDEACRMCGTSDEPLSDAECLVSLRKYRETRSRLLDVIQKEQQLNRSVIDRPSPMPTFMDTLSFPDNHTRELMYAEYMEKVKERENRLQNKVIRITKASRPLSSGTLQSFNDIDAEFVTKARERLDKLGVEADVHIEVKDEYYPKHLVDIVPEEEVCIEEVHMNVRINNKTSKRRISDCSLLEEIDQVFGGFLTRKNIGVWSPELKHRSLDLENISRKVEKNQPQTELPPIWTPNSSPTPERKSYKPVRFESPTLSRKIINEDIKKIPPKPPVDLPVLSSPLPPPPPPLPSKIQGDENVHSTDRRLPRVQSPTVTLLQKAREGQLPKGSAYLNSEEYSMDKENKTRGSTVKRNVETQEIKYASRREYDSLQSDEKKQKKMVEISPKKYEGIGPTTKEGVPIVLRSEIKEPNQPKWYKQMYESLHKFQSDGPKIRKGDGYSSEPEKGYESDFGENRSFQNLDDEYTRNVSMRRSVSPVKCGQDRYKNQPRPIENYEPGHSSIAEKETRQWWDEVMNTFDGDSKHKIPPTQNRTSSKKSNLAQALKESGYDSDSTLIFKRQENQSQCLSPTEQKSAYKVIQNGGEVPFQGLRKTFPERPKDLELEYLPITSHLTKIQIMKFDNEVIHHPWKKVTCYPVFSNFKRTAKSSASSTGSPPTPPRRESSRKNSRLERWTKGVDIESNVELKVRKSKPETEKRSKSSSLKSSTKMYTNDLKKEKEKFPKVTVAVSTKGKVLPRSSTSSTNSSESSLSKKTKSLSTPAKSIPVSKTAQKTISKEKVLKSNLVKTNSGKRQTKKIEIVKTSVKSSLKSEKDMKNNEKQNQFGEEFFQQLLLTDEKKKQIPKISPIKDKEKSNVCRKSSKIDIYLSSKKPVSESKFKSFDKYQSSGVTEWDQFGDESVDFLKGRSASEPPSRSPSSRRIRSFQAPVKLIESVTGIRRCQRSKSAEEPMERVKNAAVDYEYQTYVRELRHSSKKSERFKELHNFYCSLERLGELEKTAENASNKVRTRGDLVDYDKWKTVRVKERAENEIKSLHAKLEDVQKSKDVLYKTKDPEEIRWKGNLDRGLRNKETSVVDLKRKFHAIGIDTYCKPEVNVYRPLWRGTSVQDVAASLKHITSSKRGRPVSEERENNYTHIPRRSSSRSPSNIGCRIWSSLSMEQLNRLKTQLNEVYSTISDMKGERIPRTIQRTKLKDDYEIEVNGRVKKSEISSSLYVRSSSMGPSRKKDKGEVLRKADSIGSVCLSENEKKKISKNISNEVLEKKQKKHSGNVVIPKETLGAIAAVKCKENIPESVSPRTCYSIDVSEEEYITKNYEKNYLLVLADNEDKKKMISDWANGTNVSESSSSASTVIHLGAKKTNLHSSQSFSSMKCIFGERDCMRKVLSPSPDRCSEYSKFIKNGFVRKLCRKFESFDDLRFLHTPMESNTLKRYKSDPELNRNIIRYHEYGDVQNLKTKYERCKSPVPKYPLRPDNRLMPRINVISKLASLQDKLTKGEVERIRIMFENRNRAFMLGQFYTSTPDLREARKMIPFLDCDWMAHKYPEPEPFTKPKIRPKSASPVRYNKKHHHPSILKQSKHDGFLSQPYNPEAHKPKYRWTPSWNGIWTQLPTLPPKPSIVKFKDSPHKYAESEVTLQYRRPVRNEIKEEWTEEELANKQAEAMRRIYQEERRRKYLQELQDMSNRRHADNLLPSQKSPIPLNRYDDFVDESPQPPRSRTPEPKLVARALYNFVGQTSRELSFRKGDIIFVRKQIDKNWYEGEHNAMVGLFPFNYVEVIPYDGIRTTPHRPYEGQARAKFNFVAQTNMELSLVKGELVVLTRRVDNNWYEGRIGSKKGIFPISYVTVLVEPGDHPNSSTSESFKPVASPASHSLITSNPPKTQHMYQPDSYSSMPTRSSGTQTKKQANNINETLHVDVHSEPMPYRALYNYKPQNSDELELREGDVVFVMEKCDDGWYVGSSKRTGCFGTFPGNYVQRSI